MHKIDTGVYHTTYRQYHILLNEGDDWEALIFHRYVDGQFHDFISDVEGTTRNKALQAAQGFIDGV